jgi:phosphatidylglycerol---prolipoprotein diacylglyceryl transferase
MQPILFRVPGLGLPVFGFGLMLTIALFASIWLAERRARREGLDPDQVSALAVWTLVGGLIGARAFFVIEYWDRFKSPWEILEIWNGGIVFYGCIIGGALAILLFRRLHPFPLRPMVDLIAPSLAVGAAFGRLGCFLNGCCYGDVCHLPWAVTFPRASSPWNHQATLGLISESASRSLPVHPTQIYSAIDGFLLLFLLSAYYPLRRRDGEVMALLMVTYPVTRFLIERLRSDEPGLILGLTVSQGISVALFTGGLVFWAYLSRLPRGRYADAVHPVAA